MRHHELLLHGDTPFTDALLAHFFMRISRARHMVTTQIWITRARVFSPRNRFLMLQPSSDARSKPAPGVSAIEIVSAAEEGIIEAAWRDWLARKTCASTARSIKEAKPRKMRSLFMVSVPRCKKLIESTINISLLSPKSRERRESVLRR